MKDLNLIRVILAIVDAGSVTAAAARLNMSQPAVSQALARLRDLTGDALFTRGPQGMVPTAHAMQLYAEGRPALARLEQALSPRSGFDPTHSRERFTFALSDLGDVTFLPPIIRRLSEVAPLVGLDVLPLVVQEAEAQLMAGRVDFAIGNLFPRTSEVTQTTVFRDCYVCILRPDHPVIGARMTEEQFWQTGHAIVAGSKEHWQAITPAGALAARAIDVRVSVPHYSALPWVIGESDMIAVVPMLTARLFEERCGLRWLPLPFHVPEIQVRMLRHACETTRSAARDWMAELVTDVMGQLELPMPELLRST
ncbi:LysR family transcriptional regulator [Pseudooceanicola nanhaiensis]|uniref:LysR family transcriptional regulator n=1 Tax=Pseudooceanicola nanhaiensis TaxID=375761 RepID=UPI001CD6F234|nr:LysR family transcriptional regulator [Pseudooceanicola nanhaiensis]MCA0921447.1 LysR family transcriptional regulator [Pseudooceanicola nanhaiensis]